MEPVLNVHSRLVYTSLFTLISSREFLVSEGGKKKKRKPSKHFTEGWIEFKKKRIAKQVAALLNNKQIGGRKRSKFYDFIWNIKYLPR